MSTENLTEGSVFKSLLRYAAPMIVTSILQAVYSIVDIWIAGRYIGGNGISAISNGSLIMNLITQIAIGITVGGNVLISQYFGSGMDEDRKSAVGTLFVSSLLMSIIFGLMFYSWGGALLEFLNAPALEEATEYVQICSCGMAFIFGYNALSAILRAAGNSKIPMRIIMLSTAVNIVLDYVFVALMEMGVAGAALGTVIAQGASFITALIYTSVKGSDYGFYIKALKIKGEKLIKILRLGFPIALQWTIASVSWLAVAFLINLYGVDVSAGNGISNKIKDFCQLFITAMTSAAATMAAQNIGAGILVEIIFAVFTHGEGQHIGGGILLPVLPVQGLDLLVVHKGDADLCRFAEILHLQHGMAALADQEPQSGRDLDGLLLIGDIYFYNSHCI